MEQNTPTIEFLMDIFEQWSLKSFHIIDNYSVNEITEEEQAILDKFKVNLNVVSNVTTNEKYMEDVLNIQTKSVVSLFKGDIQVIRKAVYITLSYCIYCTNRLC